MLKYLDVSKILRYKLAILCTDQKLLLSSCDKNEVQWEGKKFWDLGVYQKMLANLLNWLKISLNWNSLKCPEQGRGG